MLDNVIFNSPPLSPPLSPLLRPLSESLTICESDLAVGPTCTYDLTREEPEEQFWYICKTCTPVPDNGQYDESFSSGCCASCAMVCHKNHDIILRYSNFFCACGSGEMSEGITGETTSCKLTRVKFDLLNIDYQVFVLRDCYEEEQEFIISTIMQKHKQKHFMLEKKERKCFVNPSEKLFADLLRIAYFLPSETSNSIETSLVYLWSEKEKKYVESGTYGSHLWENLICK